MILLLRSDSPEVYIGLWENGQEKTARTWSAGRELSQQILREIEVQCSEMGISLHGISGVVVYEGPGSYTGLRISMSVANALGSAQDIPVVGVSGDDWQGQGLAKLKGAEGFSPIAPVYGGEVYTTKPRK